MKSSENVIYTDVDLKMNKNPFTNDVNPLTNADAVKRAIRHLFMMNKYDIPFEKADNNLLKSMLFEPMNTISQGNIQSQVEWMIKKYEPRVKTLRVSADMSSDDKGYDITIHFKIISLNTEETMNVFLQRVR